MEQQLTLAMATLGGISLTVVTDEEDPMLAADVALSMAHRTRAPSAPPDASMV